ncbi:hypothetical protein OS493_032341 [Desmophyllum pertusum]|uniref:Uncharacterized protein n=1 Tax=Desmophyllum pertusum TaxID=174260 RepID=A0A9W9YW35_9CNID|nr:hypothetical protein OS493_032341 [Desmophyllum pertusum]
MLIASTSRMSFNLQVKLQGPSVVTGTIANSCMLRACSLGIGHPVREKKRNTLCSFSLEIGHPVREKKRKGEPCSLLAVSFTVCFVAGF